MVLSTTINRLLADVNAGVAEARGVLGIKPNLEKAKVCLLVTNASLMTLAGVIVRAQAVGVRTPPDVITQVNSLSDTIVSLAEEYAQCHRVVTVRSARLASTPSSGIN